VIKLSKIYGSIMSVDEVSRARYGLNVRGSLMVATLSSPPYWPMVGASITMGCAAAPRLNARNTVVATSHVVQRFKTTPLLPLEIEPRRPLRAVTAATVSLRTQCAPC